MNEYPFYLICQECGNIPLIELLEDNDNVLISCSKCNINNNEKIENIVNYSSKWVTNAIKYCDLVHAKKIPSNIYCKTHNLFLCQDCLKAHKEKYNSNNKVISKNNNLLNPYGEITDNTNKLTGDDIINVYFETKAGDKKALNISSKTSFNETLKKIMKNFNISELFIDEISLFYNGIKLDNKSEKSLKEIGISNNTTILMIYDGLLFG